MKRSELIAWLFSQDVADNIDADKNPKVILTDGFGEFNVLSIYSLVNGKICIDIERTQT